MSSPPPGNVALVEDDDADGASLRRLRPRRRRMMWDLLTRALPNIAFRALRLLSFVAFLFPAFAVFLWHYATCDRIVAYYGKRGDDEYSRRRYLDVYGSRTPTSDAATAGGTKKKPIVVFLTGGAWIIGHRMWGALLGRALVPFGILVVVPDYRNYPATAVSGMVDDVDASLQWIFDHATEYGGDVDGVVLVGQSAGAHIGGVLVALKVMDWLIRHRGRRDGEHAASRTAEYDFGRKARDGGDGLNARDDCTYHRLESSYTCHQLRGFVMTSCPYDLIAMKSVFHRRGLSEDLQRGIFGERPSDDDYDEMRNERPGSNIFERWSPYHLVVKCQAEYDELSRKSDGRRSLECLPALQDVFPKLCIVHGSSDETVRPYAFYSLGCYFSRPAESLPFDSGTGKRGDRICIPPWETKYTRRNENVSGLGPHRSHLGSPDARGPYVLSRHIRDGTTVDG